MKTQTAAGNYRIVSQPLTNFHPPRKRYNETQNNYKIIEGELVLTGRQPDGDSVAFIPKNVEHFNDVYRGYLLKPSNRDGSIQLRFEGIDTPELHYGSSFQPLGLEARDYLLDKILGFDMISYKKNSNPAHPDTTVEKSDPEKITAFIATNALEPHGRPISYVFIGDKYKDGTLQRIDQAIIKQSLNYKMLESGYAFLLAYTSMPAEHLEVMKFAANNARAAKKGVWKTDTTFRFKLNDVASVEGNDGQMIYPKLFRRCVDYFKAVDKGFSGELIDWLRSKGEENDQVLIHEKTIVTMVSLLNQVNDNISFQADTNDLVWVEK